MKFTIATGNSRKDRVWKNQEISWEGFVERVKSTIRTSESMDEYKKLSKEQQDAIKDVGGVVAGMLRDGKRKTGFVEYRSMITLDMDYADVGVWDQITMLHDFTCCIYSTHKHTSEKPRLRLIIPLSRNVSADEYTAVARMIASDIDIEQFDDTTYEPTRLMYWPSTSSDGEFVFEKQEGTLLNPDKVLSRYKDWHDSSQWPVSSRQRKIVKQNISKQADPLEKEGLIGVFCRVYPIGEAIDKFLSDVYKPSLIEGRYDYIPADSTAGVLIYDDKFAFSHHATDPACSKLCNAFDLVRLHKFGDLDGKLDDDIAPSKLPSFKSMQELCTSDDNVKRQLGKERIEQANTDFTASDDDDWQTRLEVGKKGEVLNTLKNLITILQYDPKLKSIVFNKLSDGMEIKDEVPWQHPSKFWRDADDAQLISYIDLTYGTFTARNYDIAVTKVADDRSYHPIREFLDKLPEWDGIKRVDTLLIDYLGATDNEYIRAVTRKLLCASIARVLTPGCKFDTMLVLNGPQGIGKSTLISKLCGEWFSDSLHLSDTKDKTAAEKLQGYWILEIGELAGLRKAEVETLRSFLSRQNDIYRASFGRRATPHPRQCVFIGTTNAENGYLRDTTGNRRFWPVKTPGGGTKASWAITDEEVQQIWAEALVYHKAKEPLFLDKHLSVFAVREQRNAMETDDREGLVREYLERLLPEDWSSMSLYERRNFLSGGDFGSTAIGTIRRDRVCNMEIWCECFEKERANLKRQDANEIANIMARIDGWKKSEGKLRFPIYGVVSGYIRVAENESK
ncbi:virulence-associated E family protein [Clostridium cellulovorans]|uniref:Virulence-associated E family protein n=1 Tax=Clostridium cellulovorans (strain ATCC 35296 / DSM 3052 / OCM 3 / 743B) TaxID=573061 RepID=D9SSD5_CLOC7|nr:virulence-associated E family protein [Clostridium cellulovorans]ADL50532.1 virulence-associated E family protein [Clostridium cellulovorans 743B]